MRVGVDIGGTTVKIGFAEAYRLVDYYEIKTKQNSLFSDIFSSILDYIRVYEIENIEAIGFGIPGMVKDNFIYNMPNIGLKNIDIAKEASRYFPKLPIASSNDANVAALGESLHDSSGASSSYMITLGTGVGGGLILDGRVIDGKHNACGEIGHMFIDPVHQYACTCGLKGCLETVASATGVVRLAKAYYPQFKTALSLETMTCKDIFDAAKNGDSLGLYVLEEVSKYLARGLATIAVTVDVDIFYIGGGVAAAGDILLDKVRKYYKEYSHYAVKNTEIRPARLGNHAGMLGAAYIL